MKKRVCIYYKETTRQAFDESQGRFVPVELTSCLDFAKKQGWEVTCQVSEVTAMTVHPAMKKVTVKAAMDFAEKDAFDILLMSSSNKISRDIPEFFDVVIWFKEHGKEVWTVDNGEINLDQPILTLLKHLGKIPGVNVPMEEAEREER